MFSEEIIKQRKKAIKMRNKNNPDAIEEFIRFLILAVDELDEKIEFIKKHLK